MNSISVQEVDSFKRPRRQRGRSAGSHRSAQHGVRRARNQWLSGESAQLVKDQLFNFSFNAPQLSPIPENGDALLPVSLSVGKASLRSSSAPPAMSAQPLMDDMMEEGEWPSLQEATSGGWDFCSESSDSYSLLSEANASWPGDASVIASDVSSSAGSWVHVPIDMEVGTKAPDLEECPTSVSGHPISFAERLRRSTFASDIDGTAACEAGSIMRIVQPPLSGVGAQLPLAYPRQPRRARADGDDLLDDNEEVARAKHGWRKRHTSSWSYKSCQKVDESKTRRANQRRGNVQ